MLFYRKQFDQPFELYKPRKSVKNRRELCENCSKRILVSRVIISDQSFKLYRCFKVFSICDPTDKFIPLLPQPYHFSHQHSNISYFVFTILSLLSIVTFYGPSILFLGCVSNLIWFTHLMILMCLMTMLSGAWLCHVGFAVSWVAQRKPKPLQ